MIDLIHGFASRIAALPPHGRGAFIVLLLYAIQAEVRFGGRARSYATGVTDLRSTLAISLSAGVPVLGFVFAMKRRLPAPLPGIAALPQRARVRKRARSGRVTRGGPCRIHVSNSRRGPQCSSPRSANLTRAIVERPERCCRRFVGRGDGFETKTCNPFSNPRTTRPGLGAFSLFVFVIAKGSGNSAFNGVRSGDGGDVLARASGLSSSDSSRGGAVGNLA
jgi:hypothetical protein